MVFVFLDLIVAYYRNGQRKATPMRSTYSALLIATTYYNIPGTHKKSRQMERKGRWSKGGTRAVENGGIRASLLPLGVHISVPIGVQAPAYHHHPVYQVTDTKLTAPTSLCLSPLLHLRAACASTSLCVWATRFCHPDASLVLPRLTAESRRR